MANKQLTGGTSGDPSVDENWTPTGVPETADNLLFNVLPTNAMTAGALLALDYGTALITGTYGFSLDLSGGATFTTVTQSGCPVIHGFANIVNLSGTGYFDGGTATTVNQSGGAISNGTIGTINQTDGNVEGGTVGTVNMLSGNVGYILGAPGPTISTVNLVDGYVDGGTITTLNQTGGDVSGSGAAHTTVGTLNHNAAASISGGKYTTINLNATPTVFDESHADLDLTNATINVAAAGVVLTNTGTNTLTITGAKAYLMNRNATFTQVGLAVPIPVIPYKRPQSGFPSMMRI